LLKRQNGQSLLSEKGSELEKENVKTKKDLRFKKKKKEKK